VSLLRKLLGERTGAVEEASSSPSPSRFLDRFFAAHRTAGDDDRRPELLLLGPPRGHQIEYFSHRGCRVTVEDISEFLSAARDAEQDEALEAPGLDLDQGDACFDAVLVFDLVDRLDDGANGALLGEVLRVLREGGLAMILSDSRASGSPAPPREVVFAERGYLLRETKGSPYRRRVRPNRELLRLFSRFSVQQVQLRSDGVREVLLRRRAE
jgi:SAM-dependent methyltransferase